MSRHWIDRLWGGGGIRLLIGDLLVIAVLAGTIVAMIVSGKGDGKPDHAEVAVAGRSALILDLARNGIVDFAGPRGVTRIEVRDRRVRVLSSPCPLQICRHGGWIAAAGELLVCLPNQVVVKLPGRRADAPDAVSR